MFNNCFHVSCFAKQWQKTFHSRLNVKFWINVYDIIGLLHVVKLMSIVKWGKHGDNANSKRFEKHYHCSLFSFVSKKIIVKMSIRNSILRTFNMNHSFFTRTTFWHCVHVLFWYKCSVPIGICMTNAIIKRDGLLNFSSKF